MSLPAALEVAQQLAPRLLPFIPYLVQGVKKVANSEFVKALAEQGQKQAIKAIEKIWEKLIPKLESAPQAKEAVETAAQKPSDPQSEEKLVQALQTVLAEPELRKSIFEILKQAEEKGASIDSYIEAGDVYAEVVGVKLKDLQSVHEVKSRIKVKDVREKIIGVQVGEDEPGKKPEE